MGELRLGWDINVRFRWSVGGQMELNKKIWIDRARHESHLEEQQGNAVQLKLPEKYKSGPNEASK